jgi:hypothetical protein
MFAFSNTFIINSHDALAALALKSEVLHFLAQLLIQRLESDSGLHSAVRACNIIWLAVVALSTLQTKHVFAFTAHDGIETEADADRAPEIFNQFLVKCMCLVKS